MTSNLRQFVAELRLEERRLVVDELVRLQRRVALEAIRRVVEKTPRDKGHAWSNWRVSIGAPSETEVPGAGRDPLAGAAAALAALPPFGVVYVSNPVPYIVILDRGLFRPPNPGPSDEPGRGGRVLVQGGYSTQAPLGIVAVTVQELIGLFGP